MVHPEAVPSWTVVEIPMSKRNLGTGRTVKVVGTVDGHDVTATLTPSGTGHHFLPVNAAGRRAIGKADVVTVRIERLSG